MAPARNAWRRVDSRCWKALSLYVSGHTLSTTKPQYVGDFLPHDYHRLWKTCGRRFAREAERSLSTAFTGNENQTKIWLRRPFGPEPIRHRGASRTVAHPRPLGACGAFVARFAHRCRMGAGLEGGRYRSRWRRARRPSQPTDPSGHGRLNTTPIARDPVASRLSLRR